MVTGITITESQTADWDSKKGKEVTEAFLKKSKDIQGVFAQNDEMGLGAVQALKADYDNRPVDESFISAPVTPSGIAKYACE